MAEDGASDEGGKKPGGMIQTVAAVVILTAAAGVGGAADGRCARRPGGKPAAAAPAASDAAKQDAAGEDKPAAGTIGAAENGKTPLRLIPLKPVLTNIYAPPSTWLRVEASLVVRDDGSANPEMLAAEVESDTLAFLRSVQLAQVEGTRGLLHLRDDLRERAKLRSPAVVDYLIQTMVAE